MNTTTSGKPFASSVNSRRPRVDTLGEAIKAVRIKRGLTQKQLGLSLGFDNASADVRVAQYEANARMPKPEMIQKLQRSLNCRFHKISYVEYSMEE